MRGKFKLILLFCLLSNLVHAETIRWDGSKDHIIVGKDVKILEDANHAYSIDSLFAGSYADLFFNTNKTIINFGFTNSIHWLKFSLQNTTNDKLLLEIAHASLPIAEFFYKDHTGKIAKMEAGFLKSMHQKEVNHHFQVFPIPPDVSEFYVRVLSETHPLPIRIWKKKAYEVNTYKTRIGYGFYLGFMFFVILSNIFFAISLRNRLHFYYACVVFIYTCYASMVLDGFILYLFPKVDMMFWYVTIPTIGVTVQTAYCLVFLEAKKYALKTFKLVRGIVFYFLLYIFVRPFLPLTMMFTVNTTHALLSFFIMGYVGFIVGRKGNRMGYYFATAYAIYFLLVLTEATYIQTGQPNYFLGLSHVAWATLIEAFVLSFLLSKRTEWEKRKSEEEKLMAQHELLKSTQEKEKLVKEQNIKLEQKVLQRTESLKNVNKELEIAIASKDKFFSILAHDLKSPFSSLMGLSEILIHDYQSINEEEKFKYINLINGGLNNTHSLLENLLLWSQSQQGTIKFKPIELNLQELTDHVFTHVDQNAKSKSIKLINSIPESTKLVADLHMLHTILRNLLSNAIKFTHKGGSVLAGILDDPHTPPGYITVQIKDDGVGMSAQQQEKLFDFSQSVSANGTENESGTGLGLIICKEFVEKHNGKLWVESNINQGSVFYFTMPGICHREFAFKSNQ
ncbi:sensor histidine kinase [Plebeiibacterium marinum]|uniref:histidine kinase n=1 Tax=Plebeiibacterium marinum TaxID=2992111 RepID=A0AAE3SJG1_9BACT|nr:sensor histidine kinase [Plebeiobacterium marinum]MCW3805434.1 sensor histidine kinase [Plebeiobacterium marinum]